jgi:hypothetical protein
MQVVMGVKHSVEPAEQVSEPVTEQLVPVEAEHQMAPVMVELGYAEVEVDHQQDQAVSDRQASEEPVVVEVDIKDPEVEVDMVLSQQVAEQAEEVEEQTYQVMVELLTPKVEEVEEELTEMPILPFSLEQVEAEETTIAVLRAQVGTEEVLSTLPPTQSQFLVESKVMV